MQALFLAQRLRPAVLQLFFVLRCLGPAFGRHSWGSRIGVTFDVFPGQVAGLIGPQTGAGKDDLFNFASSRLTRPNGGDILFEGPSRSSGAPPIQHPRRSDRPYFPEPWRLFEPQFVARTKRQGSGCNSSQFHQLSRETHPTSAPAQMWRPRRAQIAQRLPRS